MRQTIQILTAAAVAALLPLTGCSKTYPQDTSQAMIDSAQQMVQDGRAEQLTDLIYAEDKSTRAIYNRIGTLLGHLQDLATQVQIAFPDEIEQLKKDAQAAADRGETSNILARFTQARSAARRDRTRDQQSDMMDRTIRQLLADPYAFLKAGEDRLGTNPIADDMAVLTWDEQMVLPPLGVVLREIDGKWYLAPPTHLPFISKLMPQNDDETMIVASLIKVFDNAVIDVTQDVKTGNAKTLEDAARLTGEKLVAPALFAFLAFGKALEARDANTKTDPD